jgi:hypothetical protein
MTPRRWIEYLAAILTGNAIYFLLLFPDLPPLLQHRPLVFDLGLALDFFLCVTVYGVIRMASRHAQRLNQRDRMRSSASSDSPPLPGSKGLSGPGR